MLNLKPLGVGGNLISLGIKQHALGTPTKHKYERYQLPFPSIQPYNAFKISQHIIFHMHHSTKQAIKASRITASCLTNRALAWKFADPILRVFFPSFSLLKKLYGSYTATSIQSTTQYPSGKKCVPRIIPFRIDIYDSCIRHLCYKVEYILANPPLPLLTYIPYTSNGGETILQKKLHILKTYYSTFSIKYGKENSIIRCIVLHSFKSRTAPKKKIKHENIREIVYRKSKKKSKLQISECPKRAKQWRNGPNQAYSAPHIFHS